jgi:hypothetical protein
MSETHKTLLLFLLSIKSTITQPPAANFMSLNLEQKGPVEWLENLIQRSETAAQKKDDASLQAKN